MDDQGLKHLLRDHMLDFCFIFLVKNILSFLVSQQTNVT